MKPEDVKYPIPQNILLETVESLHELKARYEAEACTFAKLNGLPAEDLAHERIDAAGAVACLCTYYRALFGLSPEPVQPAPPPEQQTS